MNAATHPSTGRPLLKGAEIRRGKLKRAVLRPAPHSAT